MLDKISQLQESRNILKRDLDDATAMIIQMEEKLKSASNKAIEHMKISQDTEIENRKLNLHVKDLKKRVPGEIYFPMKHDSVDMKLAKFLNDNPIMDQFCLPKTIFRRQGEGTYYFGTKKIYMKLLNDNIMVRVGGGYQHLGEFITQHGEEEMMKM